MIALLLAASSALRFGGASPPVAPARAPVPGTIVVATSRGESLVPVTAERGHAAVPAPNLSLVLPLTTDLKPDWATVTFAGQPFRFLLGAPAFRHFDRVVPLAGGAYVARDTLFLPLQWLAGYIPVVFSEGYRYDPLAGRFEEAAVTPVVTRAPAPRSGPSRLPPSGVLRSPHIVVVDPGHGGDDPGNPGLYFPGNTREKDVTLQISKALRAELERRGIEVVMTRTRDTLIALSDRGRFCRNDCDLFVSIHVNSLPGRGAYQSVGGVETYFLADARTAEARRVAEMENDAVRYDTWYRPGAGDPLGFILKDLQANEYLRESAALADLIQTHARRVHPGGGRGVSQAGFMVLTTARRPAVLIETGFSTNRTDGRFLSSPAGQRRLAQAIADAIVAYLRRYETRTALEGQP